jgi:hypothetical protein
MSGPVDVLDVLHGCALRSDVNDTPKRALDIRQARSAIADLIHAAKEMMRQDAVQRATHNTNPFMADAADKLNAALDKVGAQ